MADLRDELHDLYYACLERDNGGSRDAFTRYSDALQAAAEALGLDEIRDARTDEDMRRHAE